MSPADRDRVLQRLRAADALLDYQRPLLLFLGALCALLSGHVIVTGRGSWRHLVVLVLILGLGRVTKAIGDRVERALDEASQLRKKPPS